MSQVGRNDPCPCGSGLKFKKCCSKKNEAASQLYRSAERDSALRKLMRFSARPEFEIQQEQALELFWGDWLDEQDEDLEEVMDSEQVSVAYNTWFGFDFDFGEGRTLLDVFLETEGVKLTSSERNYLEGMRGSHFRLYEILEVKPEQGFELRDLWDERRLYVRERLGTRQLVAWDLIFARIGRGGDGETVFEALAYLFPAAAKDDLVKDLKKAQRAFLREFPQESIESFFKTIVPIFHKLWLETVALRPLPKIMTSDGEPIVFAKVIFDLLDRQAAISSLAEREDILDQEDGSYVWLEPAREFERSLGTIRIEEQRVTFESMSQKRAEKARDELPSLLGGAVRFRAISYEDVGQALKRAPAVTKKEKQEIPPEVQAEVLQNYYADYYQKWLDEPVPALGNRTPRHAARLKTLRPKLITLLKDFESRSERQRRAGEIAYDFGWMWKELGLNRE